MGGIRLDGIAKVYPNGVRAVDRLDLEIGDGEFMVLVGPSGCGKSTLLRMIAGLEEVTEGAIQIDDRDVTGLQPRQRDIAMVFQNYALYPHMSVRQNLAFGLKLRHVQKAEINRRVGDVAQILGLEQYLERRPAALSGGQRQRVAIGRAMVREPRAFLMDEPLSNLDAKLRVSMRAELARLHERLGVTTVYVTHDQVEAMTLGQRVAVMRDGILQQCDTPQHLFRRPANLFVAAFIGSPSMNLLEAHVEDGTVRFAEHVLRLPEGSPMASARQDVIVGMRPTDFELVDAATDPGLPRIKVTPRVVEELGAESYVIFPIDAPRVVAEAVRAAADTDDADAGTLLADDRRAMFTARVDGRRELRSGEEIELAVDHARLHFFDPATGEVLSAR